MKLTLILPFVVVLAASLGVSAAETVRESPAPRQPGGRIHLSLQNEVDAALGRSAKWLTAAQEADGNWAASNRLATAFAVLALQQTQSAAATAARGREWLRRTAVSADTNSFWIALASVKAIPAPPASGTVTPDKPFTLDIARFADFSGARVFLIAEINLAIPNGLTVTPKDWRERLAGTLVASQKQDPDKPGTGFWPASGTGPESPTEAQTALAMLILLQL